MGLVCKVVIVNIGEVLDDIDVEQEGFVVFDEVV